MKKFPEKLYLRWEQDGKDGYWLVEEDAGNHAVVGESVPIAVYKLDSKQKLKTEWSFE